MKTISKFLALPVLFFGVLVPFVAFAATSLNNHPLDFATLRVNNDTRNPNNPNTWSTSVTANPGEELSFAIYYHNNGSETARNVRVTLTPQTSGERTTHTFTATVSADNANTVTGSATVTLSSPASITLESYRVFWRANQTQSGSQPFPNGQSPSQFSSGGINLGDIAPGWNTQGSVVVGYQISNTQQQTLPTVTISANPSSIDQNDSSVLSWSSTNATTCSASGGWSGSKNLSGSQTVFPNDTTTYTISCSNSAGSRSDSVTVFVNEQEENAPIVDLSASPTVIDRNDSTTLFWDINGGEATVCTASGGWSGSKNTNSGSESRTLSSTRTFTLTCSGPGGSDSDSVTVTVIDEEDNPVSLDFNASPTSIRRGEGSTLHWNSDNADECFASGGWSGSQNLDGSRTVYPNNTTTYTLRCSNDNGDSESRSVTVHVDDVFNNIDVSLSVSPQNNLYPGQTATLYWSSSNATYCYASGGWSGNKNTSGSEQIYPYTTTTYTIRCTNNYDTASRSVTVYVNNQNNLIPTVNIYASPRNILSGQSSVLYWNTSNATYCTASGGWSGNKNTNGSEVVYPTSNTTYTLTCSNNSAQQSGSDTVFVNQQQGGVLSVSCVASPVDPRVGDSVTFAAGVSGGVRPYYYEWSGDINSSEQVYTRTFSTTGTRVAQLRIRDSVGTVGTASCSVSVRAKATTPYVPPKPKPPVVLPTVCKYVEACSTDGGKTFKIKRDLSPAECSAIGGSTVNENTNSNAPVNPSNNSASSQDRSLLASLFVTQAGNLSLIGIVAVFLFLLLMVLGVLFVALQVRGKNAA